jgi:hypothetical protein
MNKTSDIQETADDLNNHPMVAMEDRKMDEISRAAQNTLNDGQGGTSALFHLYPKRGCGAAGSVARREEGA